MDSELFPMEMAEGFVADDRKVMAAGRKNQLEEQIATPLGTRWHLTYKTPLFDELGQIAGTTGIAMDITERKQAEQQLLYSISITNAALESAVDGILVVDRSGKIVRWNQKFIDLWNIPEELLATHDDGILLNYAMAQLAKPESFAAKVMELYDHPEDSSQDLLELADSRVFDRYSQPLVIGAEIVGRFWSFRDISERRNLEEQLRQSQKMEAVGQLAGGVAHDFNNLLTVILANAELALMKLDPAQPLHGRLQEISSAAHRSADLTRQLLAFARKQAVKPEVLNLNETVGGMLKLLRRLIGEGIELSWQPMQGLWPVLVDPAQIDQIMANLCINARDAITGVGKITIEIGNCVIDEHYRAHHPDFMLGEYVRLAVSDDGGGMNKETLAHIFEPFFTTKGLGKGTGLGLATVYGAVKQNNGFINVYSEPGLGTIFAIYLPHHAGAVEVLHAKCVAEMDRSCHETILLVEDEPAILNITAKILENMGYVVLQAGTPHDAISLARRMGSHIHLLITDVVMPEMNGLELANTLQMMNPGLKRLFMSGYTADVISSHGVLTDGEQFIQKPFSLPDFAGKVREVLDYGQD
jgi:signal transduction histidine kinase